MDENRIQRDSTELLEFPEKCWNPTFFLDFMESWKTDRT